MNKIKLRHDGDLVDQCFSQLIKMIQKIQKQNKTSVIANFMPKILPDNEIVRQYL